MGILNIFLKQFDFSSLWKVTFLLFCCWFFLAFLPLKENNTSRKKLKIPNRNNWINLARKLKKKTDRKKKNKEIDKNY